MLGHELGHQAELHTVVTALIGWLSLSAIPLRAIFAFLRKLIAAIATRLGGLFRPAGLLLIALIWIVAFQVLWLVWIADVLAAAVARRTEFAADRCAVGWGYRRDLLAAYETLDRGGEPTGRLAQLLAEHPPMAERVASIKEVR